MISIDSFIMHGLKIFTLNCVVPLKNATGCNEAFGTAATSTVIIDQNLQLHAENKDTLMLRKLVPVLAAISICLLTSAESRASTWDLADDFTLKLNPIDQWIFGSATTVGGAVTPFAANRQTYHHGIGGNLFYWHGTDCPLNSGSCFPQVGKMYGDSGPGRDVSLAFNTSNLTMEMKQRVGGIIMHPSTAQYAVARWTAPKATTYFISSSFYTVNTCGVSVRVIIARNTTALYQTTLSGRVNRFFATAETGIALNRGETIDFIVDSGGNSGCDPVGVEARIRTTDFRQ